MTVECEPTEAVQLLSETSQTFLADNPGAQIALLHVARTTPGDAVPLSSDCAW